MDFSYRLGTFFILVGLGLLFMYWITTQGDNPQPEGNFLLFGAFSLGFGIWQAWRNRSKPEEVERFTAIKKLFRRDKKKKE